MLTDFLTLERYFGSPHAALRFEDLVKNYGRNKVSRAIRDGDIRCRPLCAAADADDGCVMAWLSEQGRLKAQTPSA